MIEERRSIRRQHIDRRASLGRRIAENGWFSFLGTKRFGASDRRDEERRMRDRRVS